MSHIWLGCCYSFFDSESNDAKNLSSSECLTFIHHTFGALLSTGTLYHSEVAMMHQLCEAGFFSPPKFGGQEDPQKNIGFQNCLLSISIVIKQWGYVFLGNDFTFFV